MVARPAQRACGRRDRLSGHTSARAPPIECDLQRSVAPFSQHYLAWSHEFMIATVPHADRCVARAVLRQEVLEEDVAEDVETGLAAPSQGQMRYWRSGRIPNVRYSSGAQPLS